MNQSKLGNMKKSLLLSRDISLKDIFEHNEKLSTKKSGIALSENKTSQNIDFNRELFRGVAYKNVQEADSTQCDIQTDEQNISQINRNPLLKEKFRLQVQRISQSHKNLLSPIGGYYDIEQSEPTKELKTLKQLKKQDQVSKINKIRRINQGSNIVLKVKTK